MFRKLKFSSVQSLSRVRQASLSITNSKRALNNKGRRNNENQHDSGETEQQKPSRKEKCNNNNQKQNRRRLDKIEEKIRKQNADIKK